MLPKIAGINTGSEFADYKKDLRLGSKSRAYFHQESGSDLIQISPAFKYLSRLNWQIQKIDYQNREKLSISFSIYEFQFHMSVDLNLIAHLNKVYLEVKKPIDDKQLVILFSLPVRVSEYSASDELTLKNLEILFTRIEYFIHSQEVESYTSNISYGLYEDIMLGLKGEFEKILYAIFTFIEKLTFKTIINPSSLTNKSENSENLKLEHAEICRL